MASKVYDDRPMVNYDRLRSIRASRQNPQGGRIFSWQFQEMLEKIKTSPLGVFASFWPGILFSPLF